MHYTDIDNSRPILPGKELAGIKLGEKISAIQGLADLYVPGSESSFHLRGPFEAVYEVRSKHVQIYVDARNGKIFQLTAMLGYEGTLDSTLMLGRTVGEFMKSDSRWHIDDDADVLVSSEFPDVCIGFKFSESVENSVIESISNAIPGIETLSFQEGNW